MDTPIDTHVQASQDSAARVAAPDSDATGYGQFCPVAMAAEIFCSRWTPLILRELLCGSRHFNDLKRGVPRISPTLLSRRLKELQQDGLLVSENREYRLTPAGEDLRELVMGLGFWGARWVDTQKSLKNLDPSLLMWDMRRHLDPQPLPPRRCTIQFNYPELPSRRDWWLVVNAGDVDLCHVEPGFDVDLYVETSLKSMTAIWMGISTVAAEIAAGRFDVSGDKEMARHMQAWLGLSPFAKAQKAPAPVAPPPSPRAPYLNVAQG
ncbi:winged helix-turn-helix transcriptional regulator [Dongia rigui]|uniref:Helix-turn-helix domain-containing protein n=1 Tax=Dongia rigui TaxID=940149 RepID=A0ABU5E026_9PROT|nr:helix-turn-helix domain-containing protein [Dongia rigui]MDY0872146.1 helix-turn-helix domain-containing protein [Dongia rigui]